MQICNMRNFFILLIIILSISCNSNEPKTTNVKPLAANDTIPGLEKLSQWKLTSVNDYRQVLEKLDQGDLNSLDISGMLLKNCVADTVTRDSMFVVFNDFINNLTADYLENNEFISEQLTNSPSPEIITEIKNRLDSYGILLSSSYGTFYLEPKTEFLLQNFGSGLSRAYRDFLTISTIEQQNRFAEDGTILIPVDSIKWIDALAVAGAMIVFSQTRFPRLKGVNPSTSFCGKIEFIINFSSIWLGSGSCTSMP